jgi:hypothetical protein
VAFTTPCVLVVAPLASGIATVALIELALRLMLPVVAEVPPVLLLTEAPPAASAAAVTRLIAPAPLTFKVIPPDTALSAPPAALSTVALPVVAVPAPLIPVTAVRLMAPLAAVSTPAVLATVALPVVRLPPGFSVIVVPAAMVIAPLATPDAVELPVVIALLTVTPPVSPPSVDAELFTSLIAPPAPVEIAPLTVRLAAPAERLVPPEPTSAPPAAFVSELSVLLATMVMLPLPLVATLLLIAMLRPACRVRLAFGVVVRLMASVTVMSFCACSTTLAPAPSRVSGETLEAPAPPTSGSAKASTSA